MAIERSSIIGFDGIHRSGKGTQIGKLEMKLAVAHLAFLTVRGDGTRDGRGDTPGDPHNPVWQERSHHLRSANSTPDEWHASAYEIVHELHGHATSGAYSMILADRSLISRAAFMLHSGANPGRKGFNLEDLYTVRDYVPPARRVDLRLVLPDILFHFETTDPSVVLSRLDPDDPKYDFRARNIETTFENYRQASSLLPPEVRDRVRPIDAILGEDTIHQEVLYALGRQSIFSADSQ